MKKNVHFGDNVMDVGANSGIYTITASKLIGPKGKVYSFEPSRAAHLRLIKNLKINKCSNVVIYRQGLGAHRETKMLSNNIFGDGGNSLIATKYDISSTEKIILVPADSIIRDRIDFIKIDVEGYELEALKGMTKIIRNSYPKIVFEFNYDHLYQKDKDYNQVFDFLKELGYTRFIELDTGRTINSYKDLNSTLADVAAERISQSADKDN